MTSSNSAPPAPAAPTGVRSAGGEDQAAASDNVGRGEAASGGQAMSAAPSGASGNPAGPRIRGVRHAVGYGVGYAAGTVVRWGRQVF
jgi:hypothetical protein